MDDAADRSGAVASYFIRVGPNRFQPTEHTAGAWSTTEQHISPLTGLVVHVIEQQDRSDESANKSISRLSFDIYGVIGLDEFSIDVRIVRPGRTIELVEAVVTCADRDILVCRAWRLADHDTSVIAGGTPEGLPDPQELAVWDLSAVWPGGYIASVEARPVYEPQPGHTVTWLRTPVQLLDAEATSELARFIGLIDTANGIAVREPTHLWLFPNVELSIQLFRQPQSEWLGLDTAVTFGPQGQGLTSSRLYDLQGAVGTASQTLTIRPQPSTEV